MFQLGEWREGIALLAHAIKFDPENPVASERFFQELIVHREKALPLPIASFAHQDTVENVAFSPDGARILTASGDKTAKFWDAASGKLSPPLTIRIASHGAVFSPDGARILTASADTPPSSGIRARASLWPPLPIRIAVNHAAFSPDGARILTASADHSAKLWDAATGKLIPPFSTRMRSTTLPLVPTALEF